MNSGSNCITKLSLINSTYTYLYVYTHTVKHTYIYNHTHTYTYTCVHIQYSITHVWVPDQSIWWFFFFCFLFLSRTFIVVDVIMLIDLTIPRLQVNFRIILVTSLYFSKFLSIIFINAFSLGKNSTYLWCNKHKLNTPMEGKGLSFVLDFT